MPLKVIVVGAGIGGLACAVALRQSGADVTVLERASAVLEIGAGLGLGPNAVGALANLGVGPQLEPSVALPSISSRRRWSDGRELAVSSLESLVGAYGFPFWFAHRGDLQTAMLAKAQDPAGPGRPVDVRLGVKVTDVDPDRGLVVAADGTDLMADLVVAADGVNSSIRERLLGEGPPVFTGHSGFRTQVDVRDARRHPEVAALVARNGFESWLGPGAHVVHAPFRRGTTTNVTACLETDAIETGETSAPVSVEETLGRLEGWAPELRQLIACGNGVRRYDIYVRPPLQRWAHGRVVLIGDACHPMLPYLGQGAAQALEDGEAMGAVLAGVGPSEVAEALATFERLRIERANRVQQLSSANAVTFHLPDGPEQAARDLVVAGGAIDSEVTGWLWQYQDPHARLSDDNPGTDAPGTTATGATSKETTDV